MHIITIDSGLMSSTFPSKNRNESKSTIPVLILVDVPFVTEEDGIPITRHFTPESCE